MAQIFWNINRILTDPSYFSVLPNIVRKCLWLRFVCKPSAIRTLILVNIIRLPCNLHILLVFAMACPLLKIDLKHLLIIYRNSQNNSVTLWQLQKKNRLRWILMVFYNFQHYKLIYISKFAKRCFHEILSAENLWFIYKVTQNNSVTVFSMRWMLEVCLLFWLAILSLTIFLRTTWDILIL